VTLFGRAFVASTLGIKLLNKTVCDGIVLFFNFESFLFAFGGISNQAITDQTNNANASFLEPSASRDFRFPWSGTNTECKSESGHTTDHSFGIKQPSAQLEGKEKPAP